MIALYERLKEVTPYITAFREPDVQDQMTAIALYATPEIRKKYLSNLPLALKEKSTVKKEVKPTPSEATCNINY